MSESKTTVMIRTKGSELRPNSNFEAVVYHNPQKKIKEPSINMISNPQKVVDFDMKKSRNDVIKLAMKGFFKYKREKTMAALAIELGAKPMKKKAKNYKDLQELRKEQRQKRENKLRTLKESCDLSSLNHFKKKYSRKAAKKQEKKVSILNDYGKVKRK